MCKLVKISSKQALGGLYATSITKSVELAEMPHTTSLQTGQAEMEALIMSKFNHFSIVNFIGVYCDKHPRFIALELLAGSDLKNLLRECRPKPKKGTTITMKDLVLIAVV